MVEAWLWIGMDAIAKRMRSSFTMTSKRFFTVRLSDDDYQKLCEVKEKDGEVSFSAVFRRLIRRRFKSIFNPSQKMTFSMPGMNK